MITILKFEKPQRGFIIPAQGCLASVSLRDYPGKTKPKKHIPLLRLRRRGEGEEVLPIAQEIQCHPPRHHKKGCARTDSHEKNSGGISTAAYPGSPGSSGKDGFVLSEAQPGQARIARDATTTRVSLILCTPPNNTGPHGHLIEKNIPPSPKSMLA